MPIPLQPGEPLLPWAQRHGILVDDPPLKEGELWHSGFISDPLRIDPKYYCQAVPMPEIMAAGTFDHPNDLRRYLWTHFEHLSAFDSMSQWQFGPLMQYTRFSDQGLVPGGHWRSQTTPFNPASPEKFAPGLVGLSPIEVNEDTWFPFLRRDRWYDTYSQFTVPTGVRWSIDQPKIWKPLSVALELANRILNAAIEDRHPAFHTILYGKHGYWSDGGSLQPVPEPFRDAKVLLSYPLYKQYRDQNGILCDMDHVANIPTLDWKVALQDNLKDHRWGLSDSPNATGVTYMVPEAVVIVIGVATMATLSNSDDITLAESCSTTYYLATTIIHEIMHALGKSRIKSFFTSADPNRSRDFTEPFIDYDPTAELGYAMEQRLFGGILRYQSNSRYHLAMCHRTWPTIYQMDGNSSFGYKIASHPIFSQGIETTISSVTALYTSKILSKSFWEDPKIPRKSDNFFHRNVLLSSKCFLRGKATKRPTYPEITVDHDKLSRGEVDPGEPEMIEVWKFWEKVWVTAHANWFPTAKEQWRKSPWRQVKCWRMMFEFEKRFRQGDEIICAMLSNMLVRFITWPDDAAAYKTALSPRSNGWIVHCVGLLMMAALPIRREKRTQSIMEQSLPILQLLPNARTPTLQPLNLGATFERKEESCNPSELYDPVNTGKQAISPFEHNDIIRVVQNVITVISESNRSVSGPWLFEIIRVLGRLEEQRRVLKHENPKYHMGLWAPDWDFKFPDYKPKELVRWDAVEGRWVPRP